MRIKLAKVDQTAINMFTADMSKIIKECTETLKDTFFSFRKGEFGENAMKVTCQLFDEWLIRNLLPKVGEVVKVTINQMKKTEDIEELKGKLRKKFSAFANVDRYIVDVIAESKTGKSAIESCRKFVWQIFENSLENFLIQTSTMMASRILMHLVGIDKGAWGEISVQQEIEEPYLNFYWTVRREMSKLLPSIYALNELDWLYISDIEREGLEKDQIKALRRLEMRLDRVIGTSYTLLKRYDYSFVDLDIWKAVYQDFLSPEDVNRLGFVTTPDEIVDLILDAANYTKDSEDLCKRKVLDPACGSGTFLVEAISRLRDHLEADLPCHKSKGRQPSWLRKKEMLETIITNINGVDINPFAVFLTTMNLAFQVIDVYSEVKHKFQDFTLAFNIATHDSLAAKPIVQHFDAYVNSRLKEAVKRSKQYATLFDRKFDFVIGNPPWGAVLRGKIGPLGDEKKRKFYKKNYHSATGKYDYYVLFMERGLNWLEKNGVLAMITQVTYVSQVFGDGIKKVIKKEASCEKFIDISSLGSIIFPRWTNYPAITILRKGSVQKGLILVEVKPH